jgi:DNA-binding MarR family transcriptional regulator
MSLKGCLNLPSRVSQSPLFCLYKAFNKASARTQEILTEHEMEPRQMWVIVVAHDMPEANQKQIADFLGINHNVMVGLVDKLERNGVLKRQKNPANRREYMLILTEKGSKVVLRWVKTFRVNVNRAFAPLSAKEIAELCRILGKYTSMAFFCCIMTKTMLYCPQI